MRGGGCSIDSSQRIHSRFFKSTSILISVFAFSIAGAACGGSDKEDDVPADVDSGIVVADSGMTENDANVIEDTDASIIENDSGVIEENDASIIEDDAGDIEDDAGIIEENDASIDEDAGVEECEAGHYGENCDPCKCQHGVCSEGRGGNGECLSCNNEQWTGVYCDQCSNGGYGPNCTEYGSVFSGSAYVGDYKTVKINGKEWLAENSRLYAGGSSRCYYPDGQSSNTDIYGYLCDFDPTGLKGACPTGWDLPTEQDFRDLLTAAGSTDPNSSSRIAAKNLRAASWANGLDTLGFAALPAGQYHDNEAFDFGTEAYFISKTPNGGIGSIYLNITSEYAGIKSGFYNKSHAYSIRCVKQ